jgi:type IX secretion system PorP/SprF family membrane protein
MKKLLTKIAIAVAGFTGVSFAQQDPQFTQWMYNRLIYNPGYAGTSGAICGVAQFRQQWVNFDGAPQTIALAGDMRLNALPLGVGLNIMTDKIGNISTFFGRVAGSYNITNLGGGTLGLGLDLGVIQKSYTGNWITPEPLLIDNKIPGSTMSYTNPDFGKATFDLGVGVFYQIPGKFYAGISSTHLPAQNLESSGLSFQLKRHVYFMTGYSQEITPWLTITPNVMYRTDFAASNADLNLTLLWLSKVWVGATYRLQDAPALLIGYQDKAMQGNVLSYKIGYSYDFPRKGLVGYTSGSHEIILGVCYTPKIKKIMTNQSDRFL